jgi:hypothetical protein
MMMKKSAHEPDAPVMSADDVWDDALQIANVLRQNLLNNERMVHLQIPFSFFLSAVESFDREELVVLRQRVEEYLAA